MSDSTPSMFARLFDYPMSLGEEIAVIGDDDRLSFRRLHLLVEQLSSDFRQMGISEGTVVGLRFRDPVKHLAVCLASLKGGVAQVAIPPRESATAQRRIADATAVEVIIGDVMEPFLEGRSHVTLAPDWHLHWAGSPPSLVRPQATGAQATHAALIFLGSGTTGHPKVMAVDFPLLAHLIERDLAVRDFKPGERHYCESSLDYYTTKRRTFGCLAAGVTVMLPQGPAKRLVGYCLEHDVHHVSLTASQAMATLAREQTFSAPDFPRLPALRSLFVGSSPVSESVRQRIRHEVSGQLFVVYGSNEFGEATVATPADQERQPGTVGKACPGVLLEVVDDVGEKCPTGVKGHLRLKSTPMMHAYLADSSASNKNFRDEWYYSGDVGWLTEDGNLVFAGRQDDMMIYRGVNIYPREIEAVLESHPAVNEVAVFPLLIDAQDSLPFAVVCAKDVSENELLKYCEDHLGWRRPLRIFFALALPRNAAGKVMKRILAKEVATRLNAKKT